MSSADPPVPTKRTPRPFGYDRLGAIVVTPDPNAFPPPWPAAVYGPGFTRSDYDIFVSADYNASRGIVTVATDPAGHGYGSKSTTTVTSAGVSTTFLSYGRGRDLNGDWDDDRVAMPVGNSDRKRVGIDVTGGCGGDASGRRGRIREPACAVGC